MKSKKLMDSLGMVDPALIERASKPHPVGITFKAKWISAVAAMLALTFVLGIWGGVKFFSPEPGVESTPPIIPLASPPETTADATPDETTVEVTPEETTAEVTPDVTTPEATPDVTTPEATPDVTTPEDTPSSETPNVTPEATPEVTPEVTPTETEPEDEPTLLEQLDAVCREQIGVKYEGSFKAEYRSIRNYYGEIKLGHVFQVYIWKEFSWDSTVSETIGDYYFDGYYGPGGNNFYIYVYDGEKLIHLPDAHENGLISDDDVGFVFHKWLECWVLEDFAYDMKFEYDKNQDLSDKYDIISIDLATESEKAITYVIKVAPKNPDDAPLEARVLKLGDYEFEEYGAEYFIYTYVNKVDNTIVGVVETLEDAYRFYKYGNSEGSAIDDVLPEIHEYWEKNVLNKQAPDETPNTTPESRPENLEDFIPEDIVLDRDMNILAGTLYYDEWLENDNGDYVGTELYNRVRRVNNNLGITLNVTTVNGTNNDTFCDDVRKAHDSTDPNLKLDAVSGYPIYMGTLTLEGIFKDLSATDKIDFSKPWWPDSIENLKFKPDAEGRGRLYLVSGDISPTAIYEAYAVFYNTDLIERFNIDDPMELVMNKKWTMDKMIELTDGIYSDLDSSDSVSLGDLIAFNFNDGAHYKALPFGMGVNVLLPDSENGYVYSEDYY